MVRYRIIKASLTMENLSLNSINSIYFDVRYGPKSKYYEIKYYEMAYHKNKCAIY